MNYSDAERVASVLENLGWCQTTKIEKANLVLLFTCSVKQKAEDKVFGFLDNLVVWKSKKSDRCIGLTGCMVRRSSDRNAVKKDALLRRNTLLDFVWRIEETAQLPKFLGENGCLAIKNYFSIPPTHSNPAQVFVPISTGCNNFCSYCIVPHARGREFSRDEKEVLAECEAAVRKGATEITLLGQNVDSYKKQKGAFAKLLARVAAIPKLGRLRFSSSHPKDFDGSVSEVMAKFGNIERHLHLPAQHGDDEILRRMNRGYTSREFLERVAKFREKNPKSSLTTDLIVGFPGESDEQFENLLNFYHEVNFDFAFFSKYSPRRGTPAATFENQIAERIKKERFRKLNELVVTTTTRKYLKLKNKTFEVLVEKCVDGICEGRSSEFYLTKFKGTKNLVGKIVRVRITQPREVELFGEAKK